MTDSKLPLCIAQQNSNLERREPATTIEQWSVFIRKQLINCSMKNYNMNYGDQSSDGST